MKNKAYSDIMNCSNDEYISPDNISDNIYRNNRKYLREKDDFPSDKKNNNNPFKKFNNFQDSLDESKELDFSGNHPDEDLSDEQIYEDNNLDNIDQLNSEIEIILIDIYNNHINSEKNYKVLDIVPYEKRIEVLSLNFDKDYNIFILQILYEKIKELVRVINLILKIFLEI